jgi:hypothetical protein
MLDASSTSNQSFGPPRIPGRRAPRCSVSPRASAFEPTGGLPGSLETTMLSTAKNVFDRGDQRCRQQRDRSRERLADKHVTRRAPHD